MLPINRLLRLIAHVPFSPFVYAKMNTACTAGYY